MIPVVVYDSFQARLRRSATGLFALCWLKAMWLSDSSLLCAFLLIGLRILQSLARCDIQFQALLVCLLYEGDARYCCVQYLYCGGTQVAGPHVQPTELADSKRAYEVGHPANLILIPGCGVL